MENFLKVVTIEQLTPDNEGKFDVVSILESSVAWIQLAYCHPNPSQYFEDFIVNISEDKSYIEFYIVHSSVEDYKNWYETFGEVSEELYQEVLNDIESEGLVFQRFFSNIDEAKLEVLGNHAQNIDNFQSRF